MAGTWLEIPTSLIFGPVPRTRFPVASLRCRVLWAGLWAWMWLGPGVSLHGSGVALVLSETKSTGDNNAGAIIGALSLPNRMGEVMAMGLQDHLCTQTHATSASGGCSKGTTAR